MTISPRRCRTVGKSQGGAPSAPRVRLKKGAARVRVRVTVTDTGKGSGGRLGTGAVLRQVLLHTCRVAPSVG